MLYVGGVALGMWFSTLSTHQNYLQGLAKCRFLLLPQSFRFSNSGAQDFAFSVVPLLLV